MRRKEACKRESFKTLSSERLTQADKRLQPKKRLGNSVVVIFSLLLLFPSLLFAQPLYDYVNYVRLQGPSSYTLRWGEREPASDDGVPSPPGYEDGSPRVYPGCYKVSTSGFLVAYSFKANFNAFVSVRVLDSENRVLYQKVTSFPTPPTGVVTLEGFSLPGYIEELIVIVQWAQWQPAVVIPVFVVLDAPKSPMNPAWVSLLRYSCRWARGASNLYDAAQAITFGVFFQRPGFAYPRNTRTYWLVGPPYYSTYTFMLKALLDRWNSGVWTDGNCVDVSCLTMLALCSVGLDFSTRQLTGTVDAVTGNFLTNPLCPIGSDPTMDWTYEPWEWGYHQVCVLTGSPDPPSNDAGIWDPTGAQKEDLNGNGYCNPPAHHPNHPWPQFDYWQKPRVMGASLGLVNSPLQIAIDPRYPNNQPFWALGTWKCAVSANPYTPPP